jgi:hypothetical protein
MLVKKGTKRNPPPIPRNEARAAIKKPPIIGIIG